MAAPTVKVISVSFSLIAAATLFLYKVFTNWTSKVKIDAETSVYEAGHLEASNDPATARSVHLKRKEHTENNQILKAYEIQYRPLTLITDKGNCTITDLKPGTEYEFNVRFIGSDGKRCAYRQPSIVISTLTSAAHDMKAESEEISKGVYKLPSEKKDINGDFVDIRKQVYGKQMDSDNNEEKTILIIGPDGPSKNAVVDGLINFIFDVTVDDEFRFSVGHVSTEGLRMNLETVQEENLEDIQIDQGTGGKKCLTYLKVFPTEKCRVPFTVNIICVPSSIEFKESANISEDLAHVGIESLHSICFITKDSIPSTCKNNLASFVSVFNTTDSIQSSCRRSISFQNTRVSSKVDWENESTCLRQKDVCQLQYNLSYLEQNSFQNFFDELKGSIEKSVRTAIKVHLLQRNIERNICEYEKAEQKAPVYKKKTLNQISKDITCLNGKKPLYYHSKSIKKLQRQNSNQLSPSELVEKYEDAYILQKKSTGSVYCTYCESCETICHTNCKVNLPNKIGCPKTQGNVAEIKCLKMENKQCSVCKCKKTHSQEYFCRVEIAKSERALFKTFIDDSQNLVENILKDYRELKDKSWLPNPLDGFNFCVILLEVEHVLDLELADSIKSFQRFCDLKSKEKLITQLEKHGLPWKAI